MSRCQWSHDGLPCLREAHDHDTDELRLVHAYESEPGVVALRRGPEPKVKLPNGALVTRDEADAWGKVH